MGLNGLQKSNWVQMGLDGSEWIPISLNGSKLSSFSVVSLVPF